MNSVVRTIFVGVGLFLLPLIGLGQEQDYWKKESNKNSVYTHSLEALYAPNAKMDELYDQFRRTGFRIGYKSDSTLILQFRNINGLKPFLKKKKNSLIVGGIATYSGHLKEALYPQFTKKFYNGDLNEFKKYLKKKKSTGYLRNTSWEWYLPGVDTDDFYIDFYMGKKPFVRLNFSTHTTYLAENLEVLENSECDPIERQLFFGWENYDRFLQDMKYRKYRPRSIVYEDQSFQLNFDHNSSTYNQKEVNQITNYALDSNLIISRAKIEAYASVEGNSENNLRLQQERAEVLIQTFERLNNEDIEAEIITSENWGLFREQLAEQGWHEFDSLNEEEIKAILEDDEVRKKYEPLLAKQRYANLEVRFGKVLGIEDKEDKMLLDYEKYHKRYIPPTRNKQTVKNDRPYRRNLKSRYYMKKMLAIKEYGRHMVRKGQFSESVFDYLYQNSLPEMNLLDFFEITRLLKQGEDLSKVPVDSVILRAYRDALDLKDANALNTDDRNFKHSLQILSIVLELVSEDKVDPDILSYFKYPEMPGYSHLNTLRDKFIYENDIQLARTSLDIKGSKEWYEHPWTRAYYDKVKSLSGVEIKNGNIRANARKDFFYQFDLWEFVYFNVDYWEPETEKYYDMEITPTHMGSLLRKLLDVNESICEDKLYQVALMFHIKMLRYKNHTKVFDTEANYSYNFIKDYYESRVADTYPELAEKVYLTLFTFNNYFFYNNAQRDATKYLKRLPAEWKEIADGYVGNTGDE